MDPSQLIPSYQPLPFPLPVWLSQTLLVIGLYLHALPMNVVLGGGFISAALLAASRRDKSSYCWRAGQALASSLPLFISFAITQGIVPLLFVQLLYGPAFYTSSILLAVPWLALVFILLFSYYLSYLVVYRFLKKEGGGNLAPLISLTLLVMSIGFAAIGFTFSNNMTLMLTPDKWAAIYQSNPYGLHLNWQEPQLLPRFLHFFVASFAVAGMTLGCFGLYLLRRSQEFGRWLIRTGSRLFVCFTMVNVGVGLWFFFGGIPARFAHYFAGGDLQATYMFVASLALAAISVICALISSINSSKPAFLSSLVSTLALIFAMIVNRHNLRLFYLQPYLRPETVPVVAQTWLLGIFFVSAVALIAFLFWLGHLVWSAWSKDASVIDESSTA